jgi:hypothetical protein
MKRFLLLPALTVLVIVSCDSGDDCPACPTEEPPDTAIGDVNFFISDLPGEGEYIYVYNTRADSIVDSIAQPPYCNYRYMEVSADERYLILADPETPTKLIDISTGELLKWFPRGGKVRVSPNGKYVAILSSRFFVFDAVTFDSILCDTGATVYEGTFDQSGDVFYGLRSGNRICRIDVANDSVYADVSWTYNGTPSSYYIASVVPVQGGKKLFMHLVYRDNICKVVSYRFDNDSTGFDYWIGSPQSRFAITPDGASVLFTDPITFDAVPPATTENVFFVDAVSEIVTRIIPAPQKGNDAGWTTPISLGNPAMSPDGSVCVFGAVYMGSGYYSVLSLKHHAFIKYDGSVGPPFWMAYLVSCRKQL